jgi:hypothetical protein
MAGHEEGPPVVVEGNAVGLGELAGLLDVADRHPDREVLLDVALQAEEDELRELSAAALNV